MEIEKCSALCLGQLEKCPLSQNHTAESRTGCGLTRRWSRRESRSPLSVNRDRFSAHSRVTLTAFVEGAYLPWTKEERRASTSKDHHEIWINHIRDHVGELRLREFRTVDASRMLRAIAKKKDLTKATLQHIKPVLSTVFIYAKNEGAFDGANPVDGVLTTMLAREPGQTHAYDLDQVLQILDLLPLLAKTC